ncbi:MAG TPA: hypothetical protein VMT56_03465 [Candidatus Bathyarchaeia archaeon]|nr:hypothetical protein [Dongiaceae bacterium]HVP50261.1 hypothetical protein [Candidatus Bathyarchaeia archaeon]
MRYKISDLSSHYPSVYVAIILWIASNAFVAGSATISRWEVNAPYYHFYDLCRWDCSWYSSVTDEGYDKTVREDATGMTNWAFSPAFPLSAYPVRHWLKLSPSVSMVIASKIALLLAIYAFLLMVRHDGDSVADLVRAGALVAFKPYIIYGHAGYAEPLYFALFALAYYLAIRRQWIPAGILGAILSATRIVGIRLTHQAPTGCGFPSVFPDCG